jgi:hypothetical protein
LLIPVTDCSSSLDTKKTPHGHAFYRPIAEKK